MRDSGAYLDQTVVPVLLLGMAALVKERPEDADPVEWLGKGVKRFALLLIRLAMRPAKSLTLHVCEMAFAANWMLKYQADRKAEAKTA